MPANPYESQLGTNDAREVISQTASQLRNVAEKIGDEGLRQSPAPGKWSPGEIFCHLADCEIAFGFRLRQTLGEPHHVIQPFDQDGWAKPYSSLDPHLALETFTTLRNWNLALLNAAPKGEFSKPVTHPERGEMTFQTILETMAGHDRNHLRQLENLTANTAGAN